MLEKYIKNFSERGIASLSKLSADEQRFVVNWAQDVVEQYGSALKEHPMKIKNIDDLPFPKEEIKIALKTLITAYAAKDSDDKLTMLKDHYVYLSAFQKFEPEDRTTINKELDEIDRVSEISEASIFPSYQKYMQLVISEQKILLEDINTFLSNL